MLLKWLLWSLSISTRPLSPAPLLRKRPRRRPVAAAPRRLKLRLPKLPPPRLLPLRHPLPRLLPLNKRHPPRLPLPKSASAKALLLNSASAKALLPNSSSANKLKRRPHRAAFFASPSLSHSAPALPELTPDRAACSLRRGPGRLPLLTRRGPGRLPLLTRRGPGRHRRPPPALPHKANRFAGTP